MKRFLIAALALLAAQTSYAAPVKADPAALLQQAIMCELPAGQAAKVSRALKSLSKKPDGEGGFLLPITVYGLTGVSFSVVDDPSDTYIVVFENTKLADVAAAANLKAGPVDPERKGKYGVISASVTNRTEVRLTCTID